MSQIASSNLNSLAEAFRQRALQYRTVALHHITISGICPASRIGRPTEQARTLLAQLITHRGFLHDHAMVFLDQGDPEPFGLSVFYTPDEGGKKAFEAFQVLAEQAYRKAVALTDSTTTYWTFRNAAHERPAHLWAVGLERWAHSEEAISGIIPVERTAVQVEDNRLQMPDRYRGFRIGGGPQMVDEAAYLIKNADRVDELKDDLFSASESAVQWLVEQLEPTETGVTSDEVKSEPPGAEPTGGSAAQQVDVKLPMTDGQRKLWAALSGCAMTAKELAAEAVLDSSEDTVRQWVRQLRAAGYRINNRRGCGYFRPDAPPAETE